MAIGQTGVEIGELALLRKQIIHNEDTVLRSLEPMLQGGLIARVVISRSCCFPRFELNDDRTVNGRAFQCLAAP